MQDTAEMSFCRDNAAAFTSSSSRRNRWQGSRSTWQGTALDVVGSCLTSGPDQATAEAAARPREASERTSGCRWRNASGNRHPSSHTKSSARNWLVDLLSLGSEDAEETLLGLGFGQEETGSVARLPARFLQTPSRAQGISADLLRRALAQRSEQDELFLLGRFKHAHKLPTRFLSTSSEEQKTGAGNQASQEYNLEPMPGFIQSRSLPSPNEQSGDNVTNRAMCGSHSGKVWLMQQLRRRLSWQNMVETRTAPSNDANECCLHATHAWSDGESPEVFPTEQGVVHNTGHDEHFSGAAGEQNVLRTIFDSRVEIDDFHKNVDAQELPGIADFFHHGHVLRSLGRAFHEESREYSNDSTEDFGEPMCDENVCPTDESAARFAPRQMQTSLARPSEAAWWCEDGGGGCCTDECGLVDATRGANEENSGGASCPGRHPPQFLQPNDKRQKDSFEMDEVRSEDGACMDGSSNAEDLVRTSSVQSDSSGYSEEPARAHTPAMAPPPPPPPPPPPSGDAPASPESLE